MTEHVLRPSLTGAPSAGRVPKGPCARARAHTPFRVKVNTLCEVKPMLGGVLSVL